MEADELIPKHYNFNQKVKKNILNIFIIIYQIKYQKTYKPKHHDKYESKNKFSYVYWYIQNIKDITSLRVKYVPLRIIILIILYEGIVNLLWIKSNNRNIEAQFTWLIEYSWLILFILTIIYSGIISLFLKFIGFLLEDLFFIIIAKLILLFFLLLFYINLKEKSSLLKTIFIYIFII